MCSEVKIDYEMQPMVAEKGQAFRYAGSGDTIWGKETHGRDPSIRGTESDAPLLGGRAGRRSALDFKLTYSALEFLFQVRMQAFSLYLAWSNLLI